MKTTLHIHIGHTKCGSSTIQRYMLLNQKALLDQGFVLFGRTLDNTTQGEVKGIPNPYFDDPSNHADIVAKIRRAGAQAGPGQRLILSSEILVQGKFAPLLHRINSEFDVRILHYIRRQDEWVYSAWKQWQVKSGSTLEDWVRRCCRGPRPDYWQVYEAYLEAGFAPEQYDMAFLNRQFLKDGDLLADFTSRIGIDRTGLEEITERINPNIDPALLRAFQESPFLFEGPHDNRVLQWIYRNLPKEVLERRGAMSADQSARVMAAHAPINGRIAERFFPERAADFIRAMEPKASRGEGSEAPSDLARLEAEVADLYRIIGYLMHHLTEASGGRGSQKD